VIERLQKILARAGVASRRAAEQLILDGRVSVNGVVTRELGTKADAARDDVRVDGTRLRAATESVYLVLNKPKGVVATRRDPQGRPTVMDLVPNVPGLFPVGRLDVTTEGLILLTNDGAFAERVAHPRYEVPRTYRVKVRGVPEAATLERLRRGLTVERELLRVDHARVVSADNNAWLELTLHEGKHHEVRRLLEAVGHPVSKLRRVAFGPVTDHGLALGAFRELTARERQALIARPGQASRQPRASDRRPSAVPRAPSAGAGRRRPVGRARSRRAVPARSSRSRGR
jgi:23S rRNA pseudouridine2605 synthase